VQPHAQRDLLVYIYQKTAELTQWRIEQILAHSTCRLQIRIHSGPEFVFTSEPLLKHGGYGQILQPSAAQAPAVNETPSEWMSEKYDRKTTQIICREKKTMQFCARGGAVCNEWHASHCGCDRGHSHSEKTADGGMPQTYCTAVDQETKGFDSYTFHQRCMLEFVTTESQIHKTNTNLRQTMLVSEWVVS